MQLRTKVFYGLTACFAIACFSLVIYALSTAVDFFSGLFSLTDEETARKYLKDNFSSSKFYYLGVMGTLYLSIFGMVIVTADTVVLFIKFISRGKLLFLHIFFFLSILICGIVALAGST